MSFELLCMATIALLFGAAMAFGGYRLFLILLPIYGFFAGFVVGAQAIHYLFNASMFGTVTGWIVGFIVGLIFAVLSYLFYLAAVGIVSFSLGYGATVALFAWIGIDLGFLVWIVAVIVGVAFAFVVYKFNIQKYAVIIATAVIGTGAIIFTLLAVFEGGVIVQIIENPVQLAIQNSFWWLLFFLGVAGAGIFVQISGNRNFEVDTYNRLSEGSEA